MIPLSDKDAEDLQRWNNEQEDRRRQTSIQGKSRPPRVPSLAALDRMMRERPLGAGKSKAQMAMGKVPEAVVRVQDSRTGEWVDRPVLRGEKPKPGVVSSIKFIEGNVYVNGDFAPELTNTLKSVIKGTVQLPTGTVPRQVYGQPTMIGQQPQQVPALAADGVRVTDSLVRTYISQLEKQSGQKGTLLPRQIQFGPELYNRLFGTTREVFVFGSNEQGIHGKGAALTAVKQHGAIRGQGVGLQGNSYGIPTKSTPYKTLPLPEIKKYVDDFLDFARKNPSTKFNLTAIGTGLAGYKPEEIAPFFADAPENVVKPKEFGGQGTPVAGKVPLTDVDQMRQRFNELDAIKKRGGTERLTKRENKEYNRLKEMIRKAITVDPEAAEMPEESPTKVRVSDPEKFQQMRKRFNELDAIMKTKGLAGAELAEYQRLDQEIKSIRTESTQRVDGTSDKPGEIVSAKKTPEVKVTVKSIGDSKAPGIYADGKYAPQVTYAVVQAMVKAKENKAFWQTLSRQGGIRVGKVFVSVEDMQRLAKAIPADTEVVYNKQGKPVVKPRTTSGGAFGIAGKTLNTLGIVGAIGDILRLSKEWSEMGKRKVPIS